MNLVRIHQSNCLDATNSQNHKQVIVNEENAHDTNEFITKRLNALKSQRSSGELEDLALVIGMT